MTAGGAPFGLAVPTLAPGVAGQRHAGRPRRRVAGGRGRLREPLGQLRLRAAATLTGRVRMTVAAGAVAYRERTFAIGAVA